MTFGTVGSQEGSKLSFKMQIEEMAARQENNSSKQFIANLQS